MALSHRLVFKKFFKKLTDGAIGDNNVNNDAVLNKFLHFALYL